MYSNVGQVSASGVGGDIAYLVDNGGTNTFVGTQTWTLRLRPGSYFFRCDPHDIMFGSFVVKAPKKTRH